MTTHTSPHSLRPHRRLRRRLGWISLGAALALSASCAAAVGDAAPSNNGPRPCAIGTYDVTAIEAHSLFGLERGSTIRGSGGSMRLTIDADGSWRLFDDGSEEMRLAGGPLTARFRLAGSSTVGTSPTVTAGRSPTRGPPARRRFGFPSSGRPASRSPTWARRWFPMAGHRSAATATP